MFTILVVLMGPGANHYTGSRCFAGLWPTSPAEWEDAVSARSSERKPKSKAPEAAIRQMDVDDIAPVYHLGNRLFTSEELPILYRTWDPYEVTGYFSSDPDLCLVAEVEERVVGFVLATTVEKEGTAWKKYGYISWMGIEEKYQGSTLARRLYRALERRLKEDGVRMVIADTEGSNERAVKFFGSQGFSPRVKHVWLVKTLGRQAKGAAKGDGRGRRSASKQSVLPL